MQELPWGKTMVHATRGRFDPGKRLTVELNMWLCESIPGEALCSESPSPSYSSPKSVSSRPLLDSDVELESVAVL